MNQQIMFSDDLMRNLQASTGMEMPEDVSDMTVKFDGKGTMHLRGHSNDDKLVLDYPFTNENAKRFVNELSALEKEERDSIMLELHDMRQSRKRQETIQKVLLGVLIAGLAVTIYFLLKL